MSLAAIVVAALACALVCGVIRAPGRRVVSTSAKGVLVSMAIVAGGLLVVSVPSRSLLLWLTGSAAAWMVVRLVGHRRALGRAEQRAAQVLLACESLSGDLGAGLAQRPALERVAKQWPEFAPVAAAARLDADVATELRRLAGLPGAGELTVLAAAWQVASRSGAGLATTLSGIASMVRADAATGRLVETELAASRATANLLIVLPGAVLLLGQGIGARPWHFLLGSTPGICCVIVGTALDLAGLWWMQGIATRVLWS